MEFYWSWCRFCSKSICRKSLWRKNDKYEVWVNAMQFWDRGPALFCRSVAQQLCTLILLYFSTIWVTWRNFTILLSCILHWVIVCTFMYFTSSVFHFFCISLFLYFTSSVFHFFCISLLLYFTDIYNGQRHCAVSCRIAASLFLPLLPPSLSNNPHMFLFNIIIFIILVIIIVIIIAIVIIVIIDITLLQLS